MKIFLQILKDAFTPVYHSTVSEKNKRKLNKRKQLKTKGK